MYRALLKSNVDAAVFTIRHIESEGGRFFFTYHLWSVYYHSVLWWNDFARNPFERIDHTVYTKRFTPISLSLLFTSYSIALDYFAPYICKCKIICTAIIFHEIILKSKVKRTFLYRCHFLNAGHIHQKNSLLLFIIVCYIS